MATNYYRIARRIFYTWEVDQSEVYNRRDGLKIRASLAALLHRNQPTDVIFKSKSVGNNIRITRKK
jgi:hypothetical protein